MTSPSQQVPNILLEEEWRNNPRKNEEAQPKRKHPVVDVTGDGSKSDAVKSNIAKEPGMLG